MALFVTGVWNSIISSLISCIALSLYILLLISIVEFYFKKLFWGINELQNTELRRTEK